jgi:hypothetical protein
MPGEHERPHLLVARQRLGALCFASNTVSPARVSRTERTLGHHVAHLARPSWSACTCRSWL